MIKTIFLFSTILSSAFPSTLTLSKDSLKVYNDLHSSFKDELTITNNSKDTISLDSAYLLFDVFDTSGMSMYLANNGKLEAYWVERNNGDFGWYLNEFRTNKYKFVQTNSLVACFDNDINFKIMDEIADLQPLKVVFKDASFKDNKDRINVEERFKRLSPETRITVL